MELDLTKYGLSKGKDDKKRKADKTDNKEKKKEYEKKRKRKFQTSWLDEFLGQAKFVFRQVNIIVTCRNG